jgi:hypothetical protein
MLLSCAPQASAETPRLVFTKADIPVLKARTSAPPCDEVWQRILAQANAYCDPTSPQYAAPEQVDAMPAGEVRLVVLGHTFGRRLTQWLETLGFAYQLTGDERFAHQGVALLEAAAQRLPVTDPRVAPGFAGARGDIMRALAVGYDWLAEDMTAEQRRLVQDVSAGYVRNILAEAKGGKAWWAPNHNFMGVAVGAAGCLALNLREAYPDEAPGWLTDCADLIRTWLDHGFDPQGAYGEGTLYGAYGLSNATLFADALQHAGGPNLLDNPQLRQVPTFYAMSRLPGEDVFEARNDADYGGLSDPFMLRLATEYHSGLARWLWDGCGSGDSPLRIIWHSDVAPAGPVKAGVPPAMHFTGRGLCVFRTGWDASDVVFSLEAGRFYPGTHNQADKGQFTLYGLGARWAIDSGYGNNQLPEGRAQTVAHNCLLVDGQGQALSGAGLGTNGSIAAYEEHAGFGYALADCTEAYNRNQAREDGARLRRALRHALFVRPAAGVPAYAIVADDAEKDDGEHDFTWLMHTPEAMDIALLPDGAVLRPDPVSGLAFVETPADAAGAGECAWTFTAPTAGEYVVWARVRAAGPSIPKSDSLFVRLDDGQPVDWHMPGSRTWVWGKVARGVEQVALSFPLTAREHTLRFLTREAGAQVDCVLLTADAAAQPPFSVESGGVFLEAEQGRVTAPMRVVRLENDDAPARLRLVLHAAAPVAFSVDNYDGHRRLHGLARAVNPRFVALLLPLPGGVAEPNVTFTDTPAGVEVWIAWPGRTDRLSWPAGAGQKLSFSAEAG